MVWYFSISTIPSAFITWNADLSVWTQRCNPSLSCMLLLPVFLHWSWECLPVSFHVLSAQPYHFLSTSLLYGTGRFSGCIFYLSCPRFGLYSFSKGALVPYLETKLGMLIASNPFQRIVLGNICLYINPCVYTHFNPY